MEIKMKNCTIKNEKYSITVSSLGAQLISVRSPDGYEYIWQNEDGKFWDDHAPLLFPVCGQLKEKKYTFGGVEYGMKGHGFLREMDFAVASNEGSHITMAFSSNAETRKIYPFSFNAVANYELRGDAVIFTFTLTNTGDCDMPYMFGWHPGFNLPTGEGLDINDYKLSFDGKDELTWHPLQNGPFVRPVSEKYALTDGAYKFSEDEIYANDTMIFTGHGNKTVLSADGHPYTLELSWSENLPYLCIWKSEDNAAKFICLEPWSAVPGDGVADENFDTRAMQRLHAGKSETYSYTLKIRK